MVCKPENVSLSCFRPVSARRKKRCYIAYSFAGPAEKGRQEACQGLESIVEVLGFIIGLITNDTGELGHADMSIFGLELMYTALNGGCSGLTLLRTPQPHIPGTLTTLYRKASTI